MKQLFLILSLIPCLIFAEEPLEVRLATEVQLVPTYMTRVKGDGKDLNIPYYAELDKVLRFDLNQNGSTFTIPVTPAREKLQSQSWDRQNVLFVIETSIQGKTMTATIYDIEAMKEYTVGGVQLQGTLSTDRRLLHELADAIHDELFGVKGVASTRILYTDKKGATGEIFCSDYDGANTKQLTYQNALCVTPAFIPPRPGMKGNDYLYVSYKTGQPKIFHANLSGGNGQRVTTLRGNQLMPQLSRQRSALVFISLILNKV